MPVHELSLPWVSQPQCSVPVHRDLLRYRPLVGFIGKHPVLGTVFKRRAILSGSSYAAAMGYQALAHTATTDSTNLLDYNNSIGNSEVTIFLHYQKTDTTKRASAAFGIPSTTDTLRCGAHLPYSDGTVYWDFGGSTGAKRVAVAGLSFGNDLWCFTAGPRGMEIWQNSILRGSNSTSASRTGTSTSAWGLAWHGLASATSDLANCYSMLVLYHQVSYDIARDVTRNKVDYYSKLFEPEPIEVYWAPAGGGGSAESGAASTAGAGNSTATGAALSATNVSATGTATATAAAEAISASTLSAVGAGTATLAGDTAGGAQAGDVSAAGSATATASAESIASAVMSSAGAATVIAVGADAAAAITTRHEGRIPRAVLERERKRKEDEDIVAIVMALDQEWRMAA